MPNLHLTSASGSKSVDLWQVQEDKEERDGNVDVAGIPTFDSEETYLSGFTQQHKGEVTGKATGFRLSNQSGYSNDPVTALAEWVQEVMALVNGKQGTGFTLTHDERGDTYNVVLKNFAWTRSSGAKFEVEWDMSFRIGEGIMVQEDTTPGTANPSSTWSLDGNDLHHPLQYREQKKERFETAPMAFADSAEENLQESTSGPIRSISINARYTGPKSERNTFDQTMRGLIGQDTIVTYSSGFPGHDLDVMVNRYESTREAGITKVGEYSLELIEGVSG